MEEVSAIHTSQEDRSSGSTTELHCGTDERNALEEALPPTHMQTLTTLPSQKTQTEHVQYHMPKWNIRDLQMIV